MGDLDVDASWNDLWLWWLSGLEETLAIEEIKVMDKHMFRFPC